jgi:long-chain acyl-CoA synthetase
MSDATDAPDTTMLTLFAATVARRGAEVALRSKRSGVWESVTWNEWNRRSRALAAELMAIGVGPGDRVAIVSSTREEWVLTELAVLLAGGVVVPIDPSLVAAQECRVLRDADPKVLFAENASCVELLSDAGAELQRLGALVVYDATAPGALSFADFQARGEARGEDGATAVNERSATVAPSSLAAIMYASATSGPPKGVMLCHSHFVFETRAIESVLDVTEADEQLLLLPLAHIYGKILVATQLRVGFTTSFAESLMLALDNAVEVNPTFLACVPRLYEKVFLVATDKSVQEGAIRHGIFEWAVGVGRAAARARGEGGKLERWLATQHHYATKLVLSKVRARFGKRLRFAVSGGAPLARELSEWFFGIGVPVLEGYGLTETTAVATVARQGKIRFGSVGHPLPGVEVRVAPDGEVLIRGPNVMLGYWRHDDETREVLGDDGWLHTGDIGTIDADGFLRITDRKKDIIITAGGKNVAPQNLENLLKQSAWVQDAFVYGDGRPYVVALLTLNATALLRFAEETGRGDDTAKLGEDREVQARLQCEVDAVNERVSSFERIRRFAVVPRVFSVEHGELTHTLKVKRKVVTELYARVLEGLYPRDSLSELRAAAAREHA